jgi:hypothetical protein
MAQHDQIYIDVIVDGKMQKVAVAASALGNQLDNVAANAHTADRNLKGVSQQSANTTKNFSKMSQGMGGLVGIYATIAANVFAVSAAFNFFKQSADLRVLQDSQVAFSSATGTGFITLTQNIQKATDGLVGFREAASAAAIGAASGLNTGQIEQFAEGAKNVSLILGRDVTDSFNRLIRGVTKAEPELLDELGIVLRLADATEKYGIQIGKTAKELTSYERSQAVAVEVLDQLENKYGAVAASVELQSNAVAQLGIAFEKVLHPIQEFASDITEPTAVFLKDNIKALTAALALLAVPIIKSVIPGLNDWAANSKLAAEKAAASIAEARAEVDQLKQAQAELAMAGANPNLAAQQALAGVKSKSTGIQKLQSGDFNALSKREMKGLLNAAKAGKGAVTQMSEEMKRKYIAALKEMVGESNSAGAKIAGEFEELQQKASLNFKEMQAQWDLAMAKMKGAAATFSSFANKVMKLAGFIGIIMLIKDFAVEMTRTFGLFEQNEDVRKMSEEFDSLADRIETAGKEFEKFAQIQEAYYKKNLGALPTSEGITAAGGVIEQNSKIFADAFALMERYNKARAGLPETEKTKENISNEILALRNEREAIKAGQLARGRETLDERNRLFNIKNQIKALQDRGTALAASDRAFRDSADAGFFKRMILNYENLGQKVEEANGMIKATAEDMIEGLEAAKIRTQEGGNDYLNLLKKIAESETPLEALEESEQERFDELSRRFASLGKEAQAATQQFVNLQRAYDQKIQSITEFTTSVTETIQQENILLEQYQTTLSHLAEADERTKEIQARLVVLNQIRQKEIQFKLDSLAIDERKNFLLIGATRLETENINRAAKLATIEAKRRDIINNITIALESGAQFDSDKVKMLRLQLAILGHQEESLERQKDLVLSTLDAMEDAFEGAFEKGLADAIKGNESSLKDFIAKIGLTTMEAAADNLAKRMTSMLFGEEETPEDKIKNKMLEAADYHGDVLEAVLQGKPRPTKEGGSGAGTAGSTTPFSSFGEFGSALLGNFGATSTKTEVELAKAGQMTEMKSVVRGSGLKGILSDLVLDFKQLFDKDTPFLEGLTNLFSNFGFNIQSIFGTLLGGLSSLFSSMFGGSNNGIAGAFISAAVSALGAGLTTPSSTSSGFGDGGATGGVRNQAGDITGIIKTRYGGVVSNGKKMPGYATGGIARGPQSGYPVMMHGTEAVVPLPNNKSIPVDLQGAASQNNVVVNVSVNNEGGAKEDTQADTNEGRTFGAAISAAVQKEILNQQRNGGLLSPYG